MSDSRIFWNSHLGGFTLFSTVISLPNPQFFSPDFGVILYLLSLTRQHVLSSYLWDTCTLYTILLASSSHHHLCLTVLVATSCIFYFCYEQPPLPPSLHFQHSRQRDTFKSQIMSFSCQVFLCLPILCRVKFQVLPVVTEVTHGT